MFHFLIPLFLAGKPVILTNVINQWPAYEKWTIPYFMNEFGEKVSCFFSPLFSSFQLTK
jgi:hypothetical protein